MTITLQAGWWLLPLAITIAAFAGAWWLSRPDGTPYGFGQALVEVFIYCPALIVSLMAWLIWALLR